MPAIDLAGLHSLRPGTLLAATYGGLLFLALHFGPGAQSNAYWVALVIVATVAWTASLRRAHALAELATSRIGSSAQGYVEIQGVASADRSNLIQCPWSGVQCVWYRFRLYSKAGRGEWRQVDSGVSSATFEIGDGSGVCNVDPDFAEIIGAEVRTTYPDQDKLVVELLFAGSAIYVLGEFSTIGGANSTLNVGEDIDLLLNEWKADRHRLVRRFDLDGNGELDLREWDVARRLAIQTVAHQHREIRSQPGIHMLKAPSGGRAFLISTLPPGQLRRRFLLWSVLHMMVGLMASALLLHLVKINF